MLDRAAGAALLARVDAALNELAEVRRQVAALMPPPEGNGLDADYDDADFRPHLMLWPSEAAARFGFAVDTVRYLCRVEKLGRKYGHRWRASIPRFQRYVNGG